MSDMTPLENSYVLIPIYSLTWSFFRNRGPSVDLRRLELATKLGPANIVNPWVRKGNNSSDFRLRWFSVLTPASKKGPWAFGLSPLGLAPWGGSQGKIRSPDSHSTALLWNDEKAS